MVVSLVDGFVVHTELWLDWINDEKTISDVDDETDRERICRLFQRATADYMCKGTAFCVLQKLAHCKATTQDKNLKQVSVYWIFQHKIRRALGA